MGYIVFLLPCSANYVRLSSLDRKGPLIQSAKKNGLLILAVLKLALGTGDTLANTDIICKPNQIIVYRSFCEGISAVINMISPVMSFAGHGHVDKHGNLIYPYLTIDYQLHSLRNSNSMKKCFIIIPDLAVMPLSNFAHMHTHTIINFIYAILHNSSLFSVIYWWVNARKT